MLEYDKIGVSKRIDVNKTKGSRDCITCHCWHFLDIYFTFDPKFCKCCHDLMQKAMSFNDVEIVSIKWNNYEIHLWYMSKDETNPKYIAKCWFDWKSGTLKDKNILSQIKMSWEILTYGDAEADKHKFHRYKNPFL